MLTCQEFTDRVSDYLEGELSFGQRLSFMMHQAVCKNCRSYRDQIAHVAAMLGDLRAEPLSDAEREALLDMLREAAQRPSEQAPLPAEWDPEREGTGA